ncbi:MAG: hypothetical protein JXA95_11890 [Spirochaetales bacterium]|nr:hypothetical protein [Spirochaetales bacterium]
MIRNAAVKDGKVLAGIYNCYIYHTTITFEEEELTAGGVGYLMVREGESSSFCDWETLDTLPCFGKGTYFRHIRQEKPFRILMNGRQGQAFVALSPKEE